MKRVALVLITDTNNIRTQPAAVARAGECNYRQVVTHALWSFGLPDHCMRILEDVRNRRASRVILAWDVQTQTGLIDVPTKAFIDVMTFVMEIGPAVWAGASHIRTSDAFIGSAKPESKRSWEPEPHA